MDYKEMLRQRAQRFANDDSPDMAVMRSTLRQHLSFEDATLVDTLPIYAARCLSNQVTQTIADHQGSWSIHSLASYHETRNNPTYIFAGKLNEREAVTVLRYCFENWIETDLNPFKLCGVLGSCKAPEFSDEDAEEVYAQKFAEEKALQQSALFSWSVGWQMRERFLQISQASLQQRFAGVAQVEVKQFTTDYYNNMTTYLRVDFLS